MGNICCPKNALKDEPVETEKEIPIPRYSSNVDETLKLIEEKYMALQDIHFLEYIYSLSKFSMENATLEDNYSEKPTYTCQDEFYNKEISEDDFQVFIDNKIIKHRAVYDKLAADAKKSQTFKDILIKFYKKLDAKLKKGDSEFTFKKWHCLIPAFLFGKGMNVTKIKFLFELFAKEGKFTKSKEFSDFQYAMYLGASFTMLSVRVDLSNSSDEFPAIDKAELKKLLDACQEKDCKNLVDVIDKKFFGEDGKKEYFFEDFKNLFTHSVKEESLGFILSARGIRYLLEKNNV